MPVGIDRLTMGYDSNGADQYLRDLNAKVITETIEKLGNINGIITALEEGWVGKSEIMFEENFRQDIKNVSEKLYLMKETLEAEFSKLANSWEEIDNSIVTRN